MSGAAGSPWPATASAPAPPRFDVFLCHHSADKAAVERVAERLRREANVDPWLDKWRLAPGRPWQAELAAALASSSSCAVFVGPSGLGDWAREELAVAQNRAAKDREFRLFMVLLPGAPEPSDPSLAFLRTRTWVDLRNGIADPDGIQDLVCAIAGVARRPPAIAVEDGGVCPYQGLAPFDEDRAEFFFGREDDVQHALERLRGGRFLAVLGPSGSGKSSLVRAGIVPALRRGALPGSDTWRVGLLRPGGRPLATLAAKLAELCPAEPATRVLDELGADPRALDLVVLRAMSDRPREERLLLVVDQFEEVFTFCVDDDERRRFIANLVYAATIPGGRLGVLIAMRADFYQRVAAHPELADLVAGHQFLVSPLDEKELCSAIVEPARRVGLELEAGLAETLLADVAGRPGTLPLLEHVLFELWQRRRGRLLTLEAYVASGGVTSALARRADAIYEGLTAPQQRIARHVLLRLVQPGEGTEDARRRAARRELLTNADELPDLDAVLGALADSRLITAARDEVSGAPVVDITHEALIRGWPQLRSWINEERESLRAHRRLTDAAAEWEEAGREEGLLYRGARLGFWAERDRSGLNELERSFLDASREREAGERMAVRRRVRATITGLAVALALVGTLAAGALWLRAQAAGQRDLARSRELAARAAGALPSSPLASLAMARAAYAVRPTREANEALRRALAVPLPLAVLRPRSGNAMLRVAYSPDGRYLAGADGQGFLAVWDLRRGGEPFELRGSASGLQAVAFSPGGRRIAGGDLDGRVRLWDLPSRRRLVGLPPGRGQVLDVAFGRDRNQLIVAYASGEPAVWTLGRARPRRVASPSCGGERVLTVDLSRDGRRAAAGGVRGGVCVWDAPFETGGRVLRSGGEPVEAVALSADGTHLAAASDDGRVYVWRLRGDPSPVRVLAGRGDGIVDVAFSRDGGRVAGAGVGGAVYLWDLRRGGSRRALVGSGRGVLGVAFSADGQRVAAADVDDSLRVWDARAELPRLLPGSRSRAFAVAFSPRGDRLASVDAKGCARIWSLRRTTGRPACLPAGARPSALLDVVWSAHGGRLAAGGLDGGVRVWSLARRRAGEPLLLREGTRAIGAVTFDRDGVRLAAGGDDDFVRIWDLSRSGARLQQSLRGSALDKLGVAFTPDGTRIAAADAGGDVRVWSLDRPGEGGPELLRGSARPMNDLAISPDGSLIAGAAGDGTVNVWALRPLSFLPGATPPPLLLRGTGHPMVDVAFSADGQRVAASDFGGRLHVWDLGNDRAHLVLEGGSSVVFGIAFSRDGAMLAGARSDGLVEVWECGACGPLERVVELAARAPREPITGGG